MMDRDEYGNKLRNGCDLLWGHEHANAQELVHDGIRGKILLKNILCNLMFLSHSNLDENNIKRLFGPFGGDKLIIV